MHRYVHNRHSICHHANSYAGRPAYYFHKIFNTLFPTVLLVPLSISTFFTIFAGFGGLGVRVPVAGFAVGLCVQRHSDSASELGIWPSKAGTIIHIITMVTYFVFADSDEEFM